MTTTVSSRHAAAPSRAAAANPFEPSYGTAAKKDLDAIDSFLGKHWNVKVDAKSAGAARTAIEALVKKEGLDVGRFRALAAKRDGEKPAEQLDRAVFAYGVLAESATRCPRPATRSASSTGCGRSRASHRWPV
jgi:hypothetical protein